MSEIQKNTLKDNATKKFVACITEFCDDFNSHNGNNANNSIILYALSIIPLDSTIDSKEHTHPVAIGHKQGQCNYWNRLHQNLKQNDEF